MVYRAALGALSVAIGIAAYAIYLRKTLKKEGIRPHPFSWLLWGLVTAVAFFVQLTEGGGAGSWVTGFTAFACFVISALTMTKYTWSFSWIERLSLMMGVFALAGYLFYRGTEHPTLLATLATLADVLGYWPTIKKGWAGPETDDPTSFALNSVKFIPALFALGSYSVSTWLYPATLVFVNGVVAVMLVARRQQHIQAETAEEHSRERSLLD